MRLRFEGWSRIDRVLSLDGYSRRRRGSLYRRGLDGCRIANRVDATNRSCRTLSGRFHEKTETSHAA